MKLTQNSIALHPLESRMYAMHPDCNRSPAILCLARVHAYRKRKPCETGRSAGAPFAGPPRVIPRGRPDRWSDGRAYIARCLLYR